MNDDQIIELLILIIHTELGGDGWAYSNYGGEELISERENLENAARKVLELCRRHERGLL